MSTTRIFVVFGIVVAVVTVPLLVLYVWFPSVLGRHIGLATDVIVGTIGAYLVALALDFTLRRRQEKSLEKVASVGLAETSQAVNSMIALFGTIAKASSDGFVPSTIDDLFGSEAAGLLSLHLALDSVAPVSSEIPWNEHITQETALILDKLGSTQDSYQAFLPADVLVAMSRLRNNTLLLAFSQLSRGAERDNRDNIPRPVINFIPPEALTALMDEMLSCIKTIEKASLELGASITPRFPHFRFREDVSPKTGSARYDGEPGVPYIIGALPQPRHFAEDGPNPTDSDDDQRIWIDEGS